jgi:hypothetical protein
MNLPPEYRMPNINVKSSDGVFSSDGNTKVAHKPGVSTAPLRSLGVGLLMAGAAASALAGGKTVSVTETVNLAASPSQTWEKIKDFNGWQAWHPAFASTEITKGRGNAKGTVRG